MTHTALLFYNRGWHGPCSMQTPPPLTPHPSFPTQLCVGAIVQLGGESRLAMEGAEPRVASPISPVKHSGRSSLQWVDRQDSHSAHCIANCPMWAQLMVAMVPGLCTCSTNRKLGRGGWMWGSLHL